MISLLKELIKLYFFKRRWRKVNKHNYTVAGTSFPIDRVLVGEMSYGALNVFTWGEEDERLIIGNYVSIASGVKFLLGGNHYYNTFLTYPLKVMVMGKKREAWSKGPIVVEDDVWIGMDTMILSGVKIGKGAVIAARSVVIKDIYPYAVVAGNPARIIKHRFDKKTIESLHDIDLKGLKDKINNRNVDLFYKKLSQKVIKQIKGLIEKK